MSEEPARLLDVEAIYAAFAALGRDTSGLLDDYQWRDRFLELNAELLRG